MTKRFGKDFAEFSAGFQTLPETFQEFLLAKKKDLRAPFGKKDGVFNTPLLRGWYHCHLFFGKAILIYRPVGASAIEIARITDHLSIEGVGERIRALSAYLNSLTDDDFQTIVVPDEPTAPPIDPKIAQAVLMQFHDMAAHKDDRKMLDAFARGVSDEILGYLSDVDVKGVPKDALQTIAQHALRDIPLVERRLDELVGVKRYKTRALSDVLRDFQEAGGEFLGAGRYANVIGHPRWPHVFKFFSHDDCYLKFVRWAIRNPHPNLPRFLDNPRRIVPFYRRPTNEATIYVVKMERLDPLPAMDDKDWVVRAIESPDYKFIGSPGRKAERERFETLTAQINSAMANGEHPANLRALSRERDAIRPDPIDEIFVKYPQLVDLARMYQEHLLRSDIECEPDIHTNNIMVRPSDGRWVFTDPFWEGETPMQMHDRLMRAELPPVSDGYEDESGNWISGQPMLDGGQSRIRKKKPKLRPWEPDEIPF